MILTSGCKSMSNFSLTACLVWLIKFSISRAVAPPSLTMKFACCSEIDAEPILNPFNPDPSINAHAKLPGGFLKTDPHVSSLRGCVLIL